MARGGERLTTSDRPVVFWLNEPGVVFVQEGASGGPPVGKSRFRGAERNPTGIGLNRGSKPFPAKKKKRDLRLDPSPRPLEPAIRLGDPRGKTAGADPSMSALRFLRPHLVLRPQEKYIYIYIYIYVSSSDEFLLRPTREHKKNLLKKMEACGCLQRKGEGTEGLLFGAPIARTPRSSFPLPCEARKPEGKPREKTHTHRVASKTNWLAQTKKTQLGHFLMRVPVRKFLAFTHL